MPNELDEMTGPVMEEGKEVNVIAKQIPVKVGAGSVVFEVLLWLLAIIPGVIFLFKKINAKKYLDQLQQKIQHDASQIDNFLEQRVVILSNAAALVEKAVSLDKETMTEIAKLRSRYGDMNNTNDIADRVARKVNIQMEQYPELKAHKEIADAMQQNSYLQREITAAREVYNDSVAQWNRDIFAWPTMKIVAAKNGYTTRIPFIASKEVKEKAKEVFF